MAKQNRVMGTLLLALTATLATTCGPGKTHKSLDATSGERTPRENAGSAAARAGTLHSPTEKPSDESEPGLATIRESLADTDVLHYNLAIEIFPATRRIGGSSTMIVRSLVDGLTGFTFRLHTDLTILIALLNESTLATVEEVSTTTRRVTLDCPYAAGEVFMLTVYYEGVPPSEGFGSLQFDEHDGACAAFSFSCPYYSHTWWPCKEGDVGEPGDNSDKATVEIAVTAPDQMRSVCNGLLQGVDTLPDGRRRYRWATEYPIATYLVCFASANYVTWTRTYDYGAGTMPVEFNIFPESDTPENRERLEQTLTILDTFRQVYGLYPFINEKYGIYQFTFGGGMEHQTNTGQGSFEPWLTAHELSHQWWGDAVTCRTWRDVWLNEGFATYSEALWQEFKPGSSGEPALHEWMAQRRPSRVDGSVYCYDTSSAGRIFDDDCSYRKAAWVLHQLRHIVGDQTFFRILAKYRAAYEGRAATTEQFIAIASDVAGQDLKWFFQPWVYEVGAPAYRYGWQTEQINGQHYLRLCVEQVQNDVWPTFVMPLDVRVDWDGGSATHVVLNDARQEHFVIPTAGAATHVALDELDWVLHTLLAEKPYVPGPPVILQSDPLPGTVLSPDAAPTRLSVTFSEDINATADDFVVTATGTEPIPFTLGYAAANYTATLDFGGLLQPGAYTVTVRDTLQSAHGIALDGEIADPTDPQALRSGEGTAGGDAVFTFLVRHLGELNVAAKQVLPSRRGSAGE